MWEALRGKKTYIIGGLMALVAFAEAVGWIDDQAQNKIFELLAGLGLITMRAGVKKVE